MTHDYQPWTGELAVQPVPCPCCGSPAKVWQYVEKPDADVLRVVMCDGGAFQEERLPMLLDVCLLDMPPDAFYCQTARQAVGVWNLYAESLNARRAAIAGAAPKAEAGELQPVETIRYWLNAYSDPASGDHFMGHGMVVTLLREYLAMREAAALAAPAERGVQWQPIETAPKDGTEVLLYAPGRLTYGAWTEPSDVPEIKYRDGFAPEPEWEEFAPFWSSWDGGFTEDHPPTHWMPLPDAPGATTKGNAA